MESATTYRVERQSGVTLVFGTFSADDIGAVTKGGSPDDVLSPELAQATGATYAFGLREAVEARLNGLLAEKLAGRDDLRSLRELPPDDRRTVMACMRGIGILPPEGEDDRDLDAAWRHGWRKLG